MLPLRDDVRRRAPAILTILLIAVCALVFVRELQLLARAPKHRWQELLGMKGPFDVLLARCALVPEKVADALVNPGESLAHPLDALQRSALPLFTSLFLHAGFGHLLSNLWFLRIFGRSVESRLGALRFGVLYFGAGIAAGLLHVLFLAYGEGVSRYAEYGGLPLDGIADRLAIVANEPARHLGLIPFPLSRIPTLGASGAISGILGAYWVLFPKARVIAILPPLFFLPFELPAVLFLGVWLLTQVFGLWDSMTSPLFGDVGGIAYGAHFGGFASGLILGRLLRTPPSRPPEMRVEIV